MTVAAGFKCTDGLLICADTKITSDVKANESKLFLNLCNGKVEGECVTVFAVSANDFEVAKAAVRECEEAVERINFDKADIVAIRKSIESSLARFYKIHVFPTSPNPDSRAQMEFLVGIWLRGETRLYASQGTTLNAVEGYKCIGVGAYLSKYLINQAYGVDRPTMDEAGLMAAFALEGTLEHDEYVGGEIEYIRIPDKADIGIQPSGPPLYPTRSLAFRLQKLMWEMLHKLVRIEGQDEIKCERVIDDYCEEIRKANKADRWLIDMKLPPTEEPKL